MSNSPNYTVCFQTPIQASASTVWSIVTDFRDQPWNKVFSILSAPVVGESNKLHIAGMPSFINITINILVHNTNELRWVGAAPGGIIQGEHWLRITSVDESSSLFEHGECFSGPLVPMVWRFLGPQLRSQYAQFNENLRIHCENIPSQ